MSAIIIGVLKATIGVLLDKARDTTAARLKDGDFTDEQCREWLVRVLDDIKTKLDGRVRKDLLASVCFLEEGVCLLNMCLDQWNDNQNEQTTSTASQAEDVIKNDSSVTSVALSQAIAALKIVSRERFTAAKKCFEDARKKATEGFINEALSLEDRILATKLRVVSSLLERLEDPEAAVSSCIMSVEALHKMSAVQRMFSVHVNGGIRARFNKTKRLENVRSVTIINVVLVNFIHNFAAIELEKRTYHPIWERYEISKEIEELEVKIPFPYKITLSFIKADAFFVRCSAVNSKGKIIIGSRKNRGVLNVINSSGEIKYVYSLPEEDTRAGEIVILSLAIDVDDSVYVVTTINDGSTYKLYVFDDKFEIKTDTLLEFLRKPRSWMSIAVNREKKIFILEHRSHRVCVCGNDGRLEYSFSMGADVTQDLLSISGKNEIIVASLYFSTVHIYTEEGNLKRTIELPAGHRVHGMAFHHVTERVIVYTRHGMERSDQCQLLSYSETGELQTLPLPHGCFMYGELTSHPCGLVALVLVKNMELGGQQDYFVGNFPNAPLIPFTRTSSLRKQSSRRGIVDRITSMILTNTWLPRPLRDLFNRFRHYDR